MKGFPTCDYETKLHICMKDQISTKAEGASHGLQLLDSHGNGKVLGGWGGGYEPAVHGN